MTARVQIQIEATDAASGVLRAITSQFGALGGAVSDFADMMTKTSDLSKLAQRGLTDMSVSVEDVARAEAAAQAATARFAETLAVLAINFMKDAINSTVEYADQVREMSQMSGMAAEESSRLIQVTDDAKVSFEALAQVVKRNGDQYDYSTQGLANMSDAYLQLTDSNEKAAFMQEHFGRNWAQFVELMEMGGQKIKAAGEGISDALILDDAALQSAREYQRNLDELSDSWQGFKVTVGNNVLPVMNELFAEQERQSEAMRRLGIETETLRSAEVQRALQLEVEKIKQEEVDAARMNGLASIYAAKDANAELALSEEEVAKAAQEASEANQQFLGMVESAQGILESYESNNTKLAEERIKLEDEKAKLISQGYSESSTQITALNTKLEENKKKSKEVADQFELDNKKIILGYLERKLAVGGLTDAELAFLLDTGKQWGIYSEEAINAMKIAMDQANQLIDTYNSIPTNLNTNVNTNYTTTGTPPNLPSSTSVGGSSNYAQGGEVYAGNSYMVGENGQEAFFPKQGGRILGHAEALHAMSLGGGGANYFYGNVTLQVGEDVAGGLLEYR